MVLILEFLDGGEGLIGVVKTIALIVVVIITAFNLYYTKFQGAKIKPIEIRKQTPLSSATHTVIFTNYGSKTGVVIGPEVISSETVDFEDKSGSSIVSVEPHSTVVRKVSVESEVEKNFLYHLEYKDERGKVIQLREHTYKGASLVEDDAHDADLE